MPLFEKFAPRTDSALIEPSAATAGRAERAVLTVSASSPMGCTAAVTESAAAEGIRVDERLCEIGVRIES